MTIHNFPAEVIAEEIAPEDIFHLVSEMATRHQEGIETGFYSQLAILAELFPGETLKPFAILERMQTLLPMMDDLRARGWSFEGNDPGCTITHQAMFRAAALASLHCPDGKSLKFDREEFFKIALEQTDTSGPVV